MIPPFLDAAISRPNIPAEDLHLYQCFPTFLPWRKPLNSSSYAEEPLWQHFQVRKQKRQLAEHWDFPSTEQNFSRNFEKYLEFFALL